MILGASDWTELFKSIPDVIKNAEAGPLGIFALALLVFAFLVWRISRGASLPFNVLIFLCLFGGLVALGIAVTKLAPVPNPTPTPTPTPNTPTPPSVYTSPIGHYINQASCHPHCKPGEGDWHNFQEPIPYALTNGRLLWSDPGAAAFDTDPGKSPIVTFDNNAKLANVTVQSRTGPVVVYVQGDTLK
jgi:hypothetical protein